MDEEETDEETGEETEQEGEQPTIAGNNNGESSAKKAPDSLPVGAVGGLLVKGIKKIAPAARLIIKTIPKLWFFNKETPPTYVVSTTVSTNKAGGVFNWTVSPKIHYLRQMLQLLS